MRNSTTANTQKSLEEIVIEIEKQQQNKQESSYGMPSIFRVPFSLREVDEDAFKPKIVSLGPYHHGDKRYQEMEVRKRRCLHSFLKRNRIGKDLPQDLRADLKRCRDKLKLQEEMARHSYSEEIHMASDKFMEMMLLDGCFILEMLHDAKSVVDSTPWKFQQVLMDMLMLENQIPFIILKELAGPTLSDLALKFFQESLDKRFTAQSAPRETLHLLHQIHEWMSPPPASPGDQQGGNFMYQLFKRRDTRKTTESIPSAVHLTEAGIKFKEIEGAPLEVRFERRRVSMSQLKIYDHTRFVLRNLIAFEHCHLLSSCHVTDYVFFIDRLVNTAKDVTLLHDSHVMVNGLGSEEELAQLINSLSKNMIWDSRNNGLARVFEDINNHCDFRWWKWRAKLTRDYFGSPWSIISVVAAFTILLLTLLQTIFAARSK